MLLRRLASAIVTRYPQAWRDRYQDEVLDLIETGPLRPSDLGELFHGLLVERVRAAIDVERPAAAMARVTAYKTIAVVATLLIIQAGGWTLRVLRPVDDGTWDVMGYWAVGFWLALLVFWGAHKVAQRRKAPEDRSPFPVWVALIALPLHFVAASVMLWARLVHADTAGDFFMAFYHSSYVPVLISVFLLMQIWPGQRLVDAIVAADGATNAVGHAEAQIRECREWIAKGVPSPVADWERELAARVKRRDAAVERLRTMGYRARFGL